MSRKGFISIFLLVVMAGLFMISVYYLEMISVKKQNLQTMKDSLVKDLQEFNQVQ